MSNKNETVDHDRQQQQVSFEKSFTQTETCGKLLAASFDLSAEFAKKVDDIVPLNNSQTKIFDEKQDKSNYNDADHRQTNVESILSTTIADNSNTETTTMTTTNKTTTISISSSASFPSNSSPNSNNNNNNNNNSSCTGKKYVNQHRPEAKLSVVIPTVQKSSLVTPTIITTSDVPVGGVHLTGKSIASAGATPIQLFNSLVQLNGQDVSLFTGLPSCTPTSADGLAATGINPFFYGVTAFNQNHHNNLAGEHNSIEQQQHNSTASDHQSTVDRTNNKSSALNQQQIDTNNNNNNMVTSPNMVNLQQNNISNTFQQQQQQQQNTMISTDKEAKRNQLSKLSLDHLQAANAMMLSPLILSLSPEQENWLRQLSCLNQQRANNNNENSNSNNNNQQQQILQAQNNHHLFSIGKNEFNNNDNHLIDHHNHHNSDCLNRTMSLDEVSAASAYQQQEQQHLQQQIAVAQAAREFTNQIATIHNQHHHQHHYQQLQQPNGTSLSNNNHLLLQPQHLITGNARGSNLAGLVQQTNLNPAQQANGAYGCTLSSSSIAAHDKQQQAQISLGVGGAELNGLAVLSTSTKQTTNQSISNSNVNLNSSPYNQLHINHHQNPQAFQPQSHTLVSIQNQISSSQQQHYNDNCLTVTNNQQPQFTNQNNNIKQLQQIDLNNNNNNIASSLNHRIPANIFNNINSNVQPPAAHNQTNAINQTNNNGLLPVSSGVATSCGPGDSRLIEINSNNNNINGTRQVVGTINYESSNSHRQQKYVAQQNITSANGQEHSNQYNNHIIINQAQQEYQRLPSATVNRNGTGIGQQRLFNASSATLAVPKQTTAAKNVNSNLVNQQQQQHLTIVTSSSTPSYLSTSETLSIRESISNNSNSSNSSFNATSSPLHERSTSISSSYDAHTLVGSVNPSLSQASSVSRDTTINVDQISNKTNVDSRPDNNNHNNNELSSGAKQQNKQNHNTILLDTTRMTSIPVNKKATKVAKNHKNQHLLSGSKTGDVNRHSINNNNGDITMVVKKKSKGGRKKKLITDEEMVARKNRSKERNRVAAKRCRQKRKQFLDELRGRIDNLNDQNRKLQKENTVLKNELDLLKQRHKSCRI